MGEGLIYLLLGARKTVIELIRVVLETVFGSASGEYPVFYCRLSKEMRRKRFGRHQKKIRLFVIIIAAQKKKKKQYDGVV